MGRRGAPSLGERAAARLLWCGLAALWAAQAAGCGGRFDPPSLVTNLRVLGIAADPPDLLPGESAMLSALVIQPSGADVEYAWEWCPIDAGPDEAYRCLNDELGLPPEELALFDLGAEPTARLDYALDADSARALCQQLLADIGTLPDFAQAPSCDLGLDVTVRLTVRSGDQERVAIKRLFLWFTDSPDARQRNQNPRISAVLSGGSAIDPDLELRAPPGGRLVFDAVVPDVAMETFLPRQPGATDADVGQEQILFSFFSTLGKWDRLRSYADGVNFTLAQAGLNALRLPDDAVVGSEVGVYFVIRDGRGGQAWTERRVRVTAPEGMERP